MIAGNAAAVRGHVRSVRGLCTWRVAASPRHIIRAHAARRPVGGATRLKACLGAGAALGGAAAAATVFAGGEVRAFGAKPEEAGAVAEATRAAENPDRASLKKPVVIAISGAAGQIAYSLLPLICSGKVFGDDTPVRLRLLDIKPGLPSLRGVVMELEDAAYPLLDDVYVTSDYGEAFAGTDTVVLVGGFPRLKGMERKDLIEKNAVIFKVRAPGGATHTAPSKVNTTMELFHQRLSIQNMESP